jgi:pilus assembly protein Flp/PilA
VAATPKGVAATILFATCPIVDSAFGLLVTTNGHCYTICPDFVRLRCLTRFVINFLDPHGGTAMLNYIRAMIVARQSEKGASAVEYGLLVALIAAVIILAVVFLGDTLNTIFEETGTCIDTAGGTC